MLVQFHNYLLLQAQLAQPTTTKFSACEVSEVSLAIFYIVQDSRRGLRSPSVNLNASSILLCLPHLLSPPIMSLSSSEDEEREDLEATQLTLLEPEQLMSNGSETVAPDLDRFPCHVALVLSLVTLDGRLPEGDQRLGAAVSNINKVLSLKPVDMPHSCMTAICEQIPCECAYLTHAGPVNAAFVEALLYLRTAISTCSDSQTDSNIDEALARIVCITLPPSAVPILQAIIGAVQQCPSSLTDLPLYLRSSNGPLSRVSALALLYSTLDNTSV